MTWRECFWCLLGATVLSARPAAAQWRTALTVAADLSVYVDWCQTTEFLQRGIEERNAILGSQPSTGGLVAYNAVVISANTFAPRRVRPWLNAATLLTELLAIRHNARFVYVRLLLSL